MEPKVLNIKRIKGSWPENTVRVDRRSRWGNPFVMRNGSEAERKRVCDALEEMATNWPPETIAALKKELEAQATCFGHHLDPENNLFRILRKLESALKAVKEGV